MQKFNSEYLSLFDNISDSVCLVNNALTLTYANNEFLSTKAIQNINTLTIGEIYPDNIVQRIKDLFESGEPHSLIIMGDTICELHQKEFNGNKGILLIDKCLYGKLAQSDAKLVDTQGEIKASQQRLEPSIRHIEQDKDRLDLVLDNMPVLLMAFDNNKNIVSWNYECQRVTGFSVGQIVNQPNAYKRVFNEVDFKTLLQKSKKEVYRNFESTIICSDGSHKNILWSGLSKEYPIPHWDNWIVGIDITEKHKQNERMLFELSINESLAKSSAELISPSLSIGKTAHILIESSIELTKSESGYVAFDDPLSDNILIHYFADHKASKKALPNNFCFIPRSEYFNQGFYGYSIDKTKVRLENNIELRAKKPLGSKSPKTIFNCLIQPAIANNMFVGQIVLVNAKNGFSKRAVKFIESLANIYALAIFRKRMEWDLMHAKDKAEESDRLKSAFLANMSHEIRTPMNAIIGFSDLLTSDNLPDSKRENFNKIINNSCDDLLMLVNDIIDISKIEAGQLKFHPEKVVVNELFNEAVEIGKQRVLVKEKSIDIIYDNTNNKDLELFIDRSRLKQILLNLLGNAIKFSDYGSINMGYHFKDKGCITFYVKDTGVGIALNEQDNIFESFRQLDTKISRREGGTGLGLAISKSIAEQLGGSIKLKSKPDVGSVFSFIFPYSGKINKVDDVELANNKQEYNLKLHDKTILVVDDEPSNTSLLNVLLEPTKAKIINAQNGYEAINAVEAEKPDLILMDIRMPEMDGLEATRQIIKKHKNIPIIAQTAFAMQDDKERCTKAGCKGCITKPIKKEELYAVIKESLVEA